MTMALHSQALPVTVDGGYVCHTSLSRNACDIRPLPGVLQYTDRGMQADGASIASRPRRRKHGLTVGTRPMKIM